MKCFVALQESTTVFPSPCLVTSVSSSPRLTQIHVRGARHLAGALRSNGSLRSLLLADNNLGDEGALLLATSVPYAASLVEIE